MDRECDCSHRFFIVSSCDAADKRTPLFQPTNQASGSDEDDRKCAHISRPVFMAIQECTDPTYRFAPPSLVAPLDTPIKQELLPQVKAILILDEDGGRVSCKYHDRVGFPNLGAEAMFEHKLFRKTKSVSMSLAASGGCRVRSILTKL